ncbi:CDP-glycerol glycerophosphotransferase family protein [Candidatus Parcubacteria bacterium]|nr:CDP-glycerol glycerophosphotransferase family protein [Candidatus Parcubacteria bacterium]
MKTIFITISRGSLIRNYFNSGVVSKILNKNCRAVILTPNYNDEELFKDFEHKNLIFEPLIRPKKVRSQKIMKELLKGATFNKTVHYLYKYKLDGKEPSKLLYVPRMIFFAPLRFVPGFKKFVRRLDFKINPQKEHDYLLEKYKPDLVFVTAAGCGVEAGLIKSAKRFKVKTVCAPKSWDNMSKALFNTKTDYLIVWSKFMKEQAIKFQDYKDKEVIIAGIPQFDYYAKEENLMSREDFCKKFNFNPDKKIILYGSNGVNRNYDYKYPEIIKKFIDGKKLENIQVLVRPHLGYIGDREQFQHIDNYENFAVDTTDKQSDKFKDHWDISFNHLNNLFNSLYHADVCVNILSTLIFDATACGTPVVNIKFDVDKIDNFNKSVKRFYETDYADAITNSGGVNVANSEKEFLQILKNVLYNNKNKKEKSDKFIKYFMYKADGKSAQRIAESLVSIANNNY